MNIQASFATLVLTSHVCFAQTICKGSDNDPCKCDLIDGSGKIDISTLGRNDKSAQFVNIHVEPGDGTTYSYNPCFEFNAQDMEGLAVVQTYDDMQYRGHVASPASYDIGIQANAVFMKNGTNYGIQYLSNDSQSTSKVMFNCDKKATNDTFTAQGPDATVEAVYEFTLSGPTVCPRKNGETGSLSAGSILLISAAVLMTIYLLIGIIYNKRNGESGSDLIPNKEFWTSFPGLIKDGAIFIVSKCTGKRRGSYPPV